MMLIFIMTMIMMMTTIPNVSQPPVLRGFNGDTKCLERKVVSRWQHLREYPSLHHQSEGKKPINIVVLRSLPC